MGNAEAYLEAAAVAVELLADPAVAARWHGPSALEKMTVGGLAGHLGRQITRVPEELAAPLTSGPAASLLDHYGQSTWVGTGTDSEANAGIRGRAEDEAQAGHAALLRRTRDALGGLRERLGAEPSDRLIPVPAGWALTLDDFLMTRMLEIAVHCDDLAVSVGLPTPPLPSAVTDPVIDLLSRLAVRRHGPTAVLRALSRAERAPATIAAI